jgi:cytoskeletal protein CcmA (bactofilin family)
MAFWNKPETDDAAFNESPDAKADTPGGNPTRSSPLEEDLLRRFGRIRSALSPGTVIQGKLSFDSPVRIDGKLSGEIFSSQVLLIGSSGLVDAGIEAETVVVLGKLKGSLKAKSRVEIFPGAEVDASIVTPVLVVHEGAFVQGRCEMSAKPVA